MTYELWDVAAGKGLARYANEEEALGLVRSLLDRFGTTYAEDLELGIEDEHGVLAETISGAALVTRVEAALSISAR